MAKFFAANVVETSSTLGTATYELAGAVLGHRSFAAAGFVTGDKPYYVVRNKLNTKYEFNKNANFTDSTPDTLARGTWLSSNSNNPVVWAAQDLPLTVYIPSAEELNEYLWTYWTGTAFQLPGTAFRTRTQTATRTQYAAYTALPQDNTIPQNNEGAALNSFDTTVVIRKSTSVIRVRMLVYLSSDGTAAHYAIPVFVDSGAGAVALGWQYVETVQGVRQIVCDVEIANPGAGSHTFKIRGGSGGSNTFTINGSNNTSLFGGVLFSYLEVIEEFV